MNIIYMGTPDFAVPALKKLYESKHTVQAVFTQPDKPRGRKMVLTPPDVKVCAQELNIPVYQPTTFKSEEPLAVALYSTPGHSHEVANLAIAQFQNAKQNQNALFLLWQSGKRIGNKFIVDVQITAVG